jgi:hypothetical protein
MLTFASSEGPADAMAGPSGHLRRWLARRYEDRWLYALAVDLADRWRWVAEGTAVARTIASGAGIPVTTVPDVVHVDLGGQGQPVVLTVRLLAGQLPVDVALESRRLAEGMGVAGIRVAHFVHGYLKVTLLTSDPLAGTVAPVVPVASALDALTLGIGEEGVTVALELGSAAHLVMQGATGSGKSVGMYSLLGQLAVASDVVVTGSDITSLLLGPWARRKPRPGGSIPVPALGTGDLTVHVLALEALVKELDARVARIAFGRDSVDLGADMPVIVCVLEEYPGLLRAVDVADRALGKRVRAAVARLLSEGRKAGIRVWIVAQRADAAVLGAFERGQASHRISYRVDSMDAVRMLHQDATADVVAEHTTTLPGIALATIPGSPLLRLRSPYVDYAAYCDAVTGASA